MKIRIIVQDLTDKKFNDINFAGNNPELYRNYDFGDQPEDTVQDAWLGNQINDMIQTLKGGD